MYALVRGQEKEARIELLFKLTKITSEPIRAAIINHLCRGFSEHDSAFMNDVPKQNLNRALQTLNEVAAVVEQIKELDWKPINPVIS